MSKNVFIIISSQRKNRNSEMLANAFMCGAPALEAAYYAGRQM